MTVVVKLLYCVHIAADVKVLNQEKFQNKYIVWSTLLIFRVLLKRLLVIETDIDRQKRHALLGTLFLELIRSVFQTCKWILQLINKNYKAIEKYSIGSNLNETRNSTDSVAKSCRENTYLIT